MGLGEPERPLGRVQVAQVLGEVLGERVPGGAEPVVREVRDGDALPLRLVPAGVSVHGRHASYGRVVEPGAGTRR